MTTMKIMMMGMTTTMMMMTFQAWAGQARTKERKLIAEPGGRCRPGGGFQRGEPPNDCLHGWQGVGDCPRRLQNNHSLTCFNLQIFASPVSNVQLDEEKQKITSSWSIMMTPRFGEESG